MHLHVLSCDVCNRPRLVTSFPESPTLELGRVGLLLEAALLLIFLWREDERVVQWVWCELGCDLNICPASVTCHN